MLDLPLKDLRVLQEFSEEEGSDFRAEIITAYRQSGLSQVAFCREWGLSYSRFKNWVRPPKKPAASDQEKMGFVPLVASADSEGLNFRSLLPLN